jgi:hypothetical protein
LKYCAEDEDENYRTGDLVGKNAVRSFTERCFGGLGMTDGLSTYLVDAAISELRFTKLFSGCRDIILQDFEIADSGAIQSVLPAFQSSVVGTDAQGLSTARPLGQMRVAGQPLSDRLKGAGGQLVHLETRLLRWTGLCPYHLKYPGAEFRDALAFAGHEWHDRYTQLPFKFGDVDIETLVLRHIHHVQDKQRRQAEFHDLSCQVEVSLQVAGIDDGNNKAEFEGMSRSAEQYVSGDFIVEGLWHEAVKTRQVV